MKAELTLPSELVDSIADRVINNLKSIIKDNGNHPATEDAVFNKKGLSDYLKLSESTINKNGCGMVKREPARILKCCKNDRGCLFQGNEGDPRMVRHG